MSKNYYKMIFDYNILVIVCLFDEYSCLLEYTFASLVPYRPVEATIPSPTWWKGRGEGYSVGCNMQPHH